MHGQDQDDAMAWAKRMGGHVQDVADYKNSADMHVEQHRLTDCEEIRQWDVVL